MKAFFKNILIPVDLTINTEVSVQKALEFAEAGTSIHLLYVDDNGLKGIFSSFKKYFTDPGKLTVKKDIEKSMRDLKLTLERVFDNIEVRSWIIVTDSIQDAIEKKALQLQADLIVISKNYTHPWLPFLNTVTPCKLFKNTGIAILTVTPAAAGHKVKKIVMPVTGEDSIQLKIQMITNLCKKFKLDIHLLTFTSWNNNGSIISSFLQAYQCLRLNNNCHVEYAVLYGNNKAKAILKYAEKIEADVLIVHPGSETKIGWPNKYISDALPTTSRIHVLAV